MKKKILLPLICCAMWVAGCSEESPIEGLTASRSTATSVNVEVAMGTIRSFPLQVNGQSLTLEINNANASGSGYEIRQCTVIFYGTAAIMPISANSAYLSPAPAGTEINASMFSHPTASGSLFYVTRPFNASNYNYLNTNGVRYGSGCYIPFMVRPANGQGTPSFGYLQVSVAEDKVVLHKIAWAPGTLPAGE